MIDNQDNSFDTHTNESAPNQRAISAEKPTDETALDFSRLTHQNWLFINGFLSSGNVTKAYSLAKYEGNDPSAPYQVFKRLKPYIEQIGDLDVTSRARLQADLKPLLDLPLDPDKKTVTLSEWLRLRKFVGNLTPDAKTAKPNISVLVINRGSKDGEKGNGHTEITIPTTHTPQKDVIDAQIINPNDKA